MTLSTPRDWIIKKSQADKAQSICETLASPGVNHFKMKRKNPSQSQALQPEQITVIQQTVFQVVEKNLAPEYFLVDVEFIKDLGYWALRIYVDLKQGAISLSECEAISRQIEPAIEALSVFGDMAYNLEVSSPGLFRPLKTMREFEFYQGEPIRITGVAETKNKKKAAKLLPNQLPTLLEGHLRGYAEATQTVSVQIKSPSEITEWPLEPGQAVYLNPTIHFPDDAEDSEPVMETSP